MSYIFNVQGRFTKQFIGITNKEYHDRLPCLEYRRARVDMIETFKILHELYDKKAANNHFTLSNSTRGHSLLLYFSVTYATLCHVTYGTN